MVVAGRRAGTTHAGHTTLGTQWLQHPPASPPLLAPAPQTSIALSLPFAFQITFEISKPEESQIPIWIILGSTLGGLLLLALLVLVLWKVSSALGGGAVLRGDPCLCAHSSHLSCGCWGKTQPHTKGALLGTAAAFLFFPHPLCSHFRLQPPDDIPLKERRSHAASPSDAGLFLFSLIPTARLFSERQPPAGGGGAAERSGAGVMLAGGGAPLAASWAHCPPPLSVLGEPGGASGRGCALWGGCEIASTAPKPKRKHEDRWPKKKPYTHPPIRWLYAMGAQREELKTAWGTAAPMRQAGANPAPNVGLQHLHGHHLYRIHYFSDTLYLLLSITELCQTPGPTCPPLPPERGQKDQSLAPSAGQRWGGHRVGVASSFMH